MAIKVIDMPAERPLCQHCGKKLAYMSDVVETREVRRGEWGDGSPKIVKIPTVKRWLFWRAYPRRSKPLFCTLTCALSYAELAWDALRGRRRG